MQLIDKQFHSFGIRTLPLSKLPKMLLVDRSQAQARQYNIDGYPNMLTWSPHTQKKKSRLPILISKLEQLQELARLRSIDQHNTLRPQWVALVVMTPGSELLFSYPDSDFGCFWPFGPSGVGSCWDPSCSSQLFGLFIIIIRKAVFCKVFF